MIVDDVLSRGVGSRYAQAIVLKCIGEVGVEPIVRQRQVDKTGASDFNVGTKRFQRDVGN